MAGQKLRKFEIKDGSFIVRGDKEKYSKFMEVMFGAVWSATGKQLKNNPGWTVKAEHGSEMKKLFYEINKAKNDELILKKYIDQKLDQKGNGTKIIKSSTTGTTVKIIPYVNKDEIEEDSEEEEEEEAKPVVKPVAKPATKPEVKKVELKQPEVKKEVKPVAKVTEIKEVKKIDKKPEIKKPKSESDESDDDEEEEISTQPKISPPHKKKYANEKYNQSGISAKSSKDTGSAEKVDVSDKKLKKALKFYNDHIRAIEYYNKLSKTPGQNDELDDSDDADQSDISSGEYSLLD